MTAPDIFPSSQTVIPSAARDLKGGLDEKFGRESLRFLGCSAPSE
jgi:hypothetical protein